MRRRIVKKPRTKADLFENFVFIGEDNLAWISTGPNKPNICDDALNAGLRKSRLDAAERLLQAAEEDFRKLVEMPGIGRRWRSAHERLQGIRVWPIHGFKKYLVLAGI